jgi:hypothetical protein
LIAHLHFYLPIRQCAPALLDLGYGNPFQISLLFADLPCA